MPVGLGSGESSLPGFRMAALSLRPHMAERLSQRQTASSLVSSYKGTKSIMRAPPHDLIQTSQKASSPNTIVLPVRASSCEF